MCVSLFSCQRFEHNISASLYGPRLEKLPQLVNRLFESIHHRHHQPVLSEERGELLYEQPNRMTQDVRKVRERFERPSRVPCPHTTVPCKNTGRGPTYRQTRGMLYCMGHLAFSQDPTRAGVAHQRNKWYFVHYSSSNRVGSFAVVNAGRFFFDRILISPKPFAGGDIQDLESRVSRSLFGEIPKDGRPDGIMDPLLSYGWCSHHVRTR